MRFAPFRLLVPIVAFTSASAPPAGAALNEGARADSPASPPVLTEPRSPTATTPPIVAPVVSQDFQIFAALVQPTGSSTPAQAPVFPVGCGINMAQGSLPYGQVW